MAYTKLIFVCFIFTIIFVNVFAATVYRKQRSISENHRENRETETMETCKNQTPCGWAVYKPFTRNIQFFMKNQCVCPTGTDCINSDDDLSVSAYVYRCK